MKPLRYFVLAGLLAAGLASAQETPAPDAPALDEAGSAAKAALAQKLEAADAIEKLSFDFTTTIKVADPDQPVNEEIVGYIALQGERDLFFRSEGEGGKVEGYQNADKAWRHVVDRAVYEEAESFEDRGLLIARLGGNQLQQMGNLFLGAYLHNSPMLLEGLQAGSVEAGDPGQTINLEYEEYEVTLQYASADAALPLQIAIDFSRLVDGQIPPPADGSPTIAVLTALKNVNTAPELTAEQFAFNAPEGVEKLEPNQPPKSPLLGKPAPPITLDTLDGGKLDLAALKGKKVVLLDFWATWCGPCRAALPVISQVGKDFADKGVAFYAVNIQETPEQVKAFLAKMDLDVPVAMDTEGTAQEAYQANSIPTTVIVGKDGLVQAVHLGFAPQVREQLIKELTTLTEGGSLVKSE